MKAVLLGAVIGFVAASCGSTRPITRCTVSNCDGCCDESGLCQKGTSIDNCGSAAATCIACAGTGAACVKLVATNEYGGSCRGGTNGTDGGSSSMGTGDAGVCNPSTCPNGCCNGNQCVTVTTTAKCGKGGLACGVCAAGNTCVTGACTVCIGCVDISTGQCRGGTEQTACGKAGTYCQTCDTTSGQSCSNNTCAGGTLCNAINCVDGCCDGNTCKPRAEWTQFQCGGGMPGAACIACQGACDKGDAGTCTGGSGGDDGGLGLPGLGGCMTSADCPGAGGDPASVCCDSGPLVGSVCRKPNDKCFWNGSFGTTKCSAATKACQ